MAAADMLVTVAGAGDNSGSTWANAMAMADWLTDMTDNAEAGDRYFVEEGTYTLAGAFDASAKAGSSAAPIEIIGVKSGTTNEPPVFSDHAFTTARPLIVCAANSFKFGSYWKIFNIRITSAEAVGFSVTTFCILHNCSSVNSGGHGFACSSSSHYTSCEAQSNGLAFRAGGPGVIYVACYAHDSPYGFQAASGVMYVFNSIADTCSTAGINFDSRSGSMALGNTVYNCGIGIRGTTAIYCVCLNNIIDACTTGASWPSEYKSNIWDYNCWDNTSDTSNVTKGDHAQTGDPGLADPANGDFTVTQADTNVHDKGLDVGELTGATV